VLLATVLALASAGLHAAWNLRAKSSTDRFVTLWGQFAVAGLLCAVPLAIVGLPDSEAWPFLAITAVVHVPYMVALARAYDHGDFSLAYPLARGGGALVAAIGGLALLDDRLSLAGWLAVAVVTGGLASFVRPGTPAPALRTALFVALMIGTYTVADTAGVRRTETAPYILATFAGIGVTVTVWGVLMRRGAVMWSSMTSSWRRHATSALASIAAYGLVLIAVRRAPVGYVTALRESSVVLAAVAGWRLLDEGFGLARVASSAVVLSGLVLLVIAR
jgi:drug/metabolite transporter (DMT)-like permease